MKRSGAMVVATAVLLSRIAGFVRESVFAAYFGNSAAADAFRAALRIPNFLQNLFGEGVLSASFIPVYSSLLGEGRESEARVLAKRVGGVLVLLSSIIAVLGILGASILVEVIAPGFEGGTRELAVQLVQIFFPGTALLVMSAWCLGILNSHRRFFLPYVAPVVWNAAIISTLLWFGPGSEQQQLAREVAWGLVVGSFLQFALQLPSCIKLIRGTGAEVSAVRDSLCLVWRNLLPVVFGRGVVQVSAFVDSMIASLLPIGSIAALGYAQVLYLLPVSLFGMSVSAAELPELSRLTDHSVLRSRIERARIHVLLFVLPTTVAFVVLGDVLIAAVFERGAFGARDTFVVSTTLALMAFGLPAATLSRLLSSTFYALHDTRSPVRIAIVRVVLSSALSAWLALSLSVALGVPEALRLAGLALGGVVGAWLEYLLLLRKLRSRLGGLTMYDSAVSRVLLSALGAGVATLLARLAISSLHSAGGGWEALLIAVIQCGIFGAAYLVLLRVLFPEAVRQVISRFASRRK